VRSVAAAVTRGFATLFAGRGLVTALQFVTLGLLASHLGPSGLGVYTFALAIAAVFRALPDFGLSPIATRDVAQRPEHEPWLLPNLAYLRLALGCVAYALLAVTVTVFDFGAGSASGALIAGLVLLVALDIFRASIEVRLRFGVIVLADLVEAAATVAVVAILVAADAGVESVLWTYVALKAVNSIIVLVAARRLTTFDWRPRVDRWRTLLATALPVGAAGVLATVYFKVDAVVLAALKPAADVGQYGVAYRFMEALLVVPALMMAVLAPVLSRSFVEREGVVQRRYAQAVHLSSVAAIGVGVGGAMTAWRVLPELPGFASYDGAGVALSVLAPAVGLIFVGTIVQGVLISGHEQWRLLVISAYGLALNVVLIVALIPPFSYVGAAIATLATEVLLVLLSLRAARRRLGLGWPLDRLVRAVAAGAVFAAVVALAYLVDARLQLAFAVAVFWPLAYALGAIGREDVQGFRPARG
jgi:O-antigen/teichoic acid export membrane protein